MKKKILSVMITALIMVTLVACGNVSDVISNLKPDEDVEVETFDEEEDSEKAEGFSDTSMDGGAPVPEETTETVSEETTEVVVPVETTFTLMSEDGSAVAFEGIVPEGFTLVSGDGTNHIEFIDDEHPEVTVHFDAGTNNDVLAAWKGDGYWPGRPEKLEPIVNAEDVAFESDDIYNTTGFSFKINGANQLTLSSGIDHFVYKLSEDDVYREYGKYGLGYCDCHYYKGTEFRFGDTHAEQFGYVTYKIGIFGGGRQEDPLSENPFTITITAKQPNFELMSEEEYNNYDHDGFNELVNGGKYAQEILDSFSN